MYNERSIEKILTYLYNNNDFLISSTYPLKIEDFVIKKYQAIYSSMYNLYILGNDNIDIKDIVAYFKEQQEMYDKFIEDGGMDILYQICFDETSINFDYHYSQIKKYSLLRDLVKNGIEIKEIYDKDLPPDKFEKQLSKFNAMSLEDIIKFYESKINSIENKYQNLVDKSCINVGDNIENLYYELQTIPEIGFPLDGEIYNTITRGARLKKLYIMTH